MPTPIPITRKASDYDSFGSLKPASVNLSQSGSFREPTSFGKETTNDLMEFTMSRFSTSVESEATVAPSSFSRLETTFCRNFTCCGQSLDDLHDLLQHYEERHVKFEDDDLASVTEDDMTSSSSSSSSDSSSQPPSPKPSAGELKRKASTCVDVYGENTSAFDTAVMRSPNPSASTSTTSKGKKRSFGQYSSSNPNTNPAVHQSLRRALMDGGIGRGSAGAGRQPSIYSANSPFSTPGSSIPGTPVGEDSEMFGSGPNGSSAFSALNIRSNSEDHHLPSCAPPNLFFPSANVHGGSSKSQKTSSSSHGNGSGIVASGSSSSSESPSSPVATAASIITAAGLPSEKPYKCLAQGCDKAYKQANGLKYHRLHGQCNQNNIPLQSKNGTYLEHAVARSSSPSSRASPSEGSPSPTLTSRGIFNITTSLSSSPVGSPTGSRQASVSPGTSGPFSDPMNNTPASSAPSSPALANGELPNLACEKLYICQVGECGKRYKNLNGLRYHYAHSGSHGALGLALLQANGGGASAKVNEATGRPTVSTSTLSSAALAAAAETAAKSQSSQPSRYNVGGNTSPLPHALPKSSSKAK